ncbi:MAG: hypothetical protein ACI37Z_05365 [Candidatus Gastranaerophilaceae bacterium]
MKTKILIIISLVCIVLVCGGCRYTREENISNNESDLQNNDVKSYTEEEINKMVEENKYPKSYIKDTDDVINVSDIKVFVKDIKVTENVSELDEKDFLDFSGDIKNRISSDNKFKTYSRISYMPINGGLDIKTIGVTNDVQPELLLVDFVWKNTTDKKVQFTVTPGLCYFKYSEIDEEFVGEAEGHIQYKSSDGKHYLSEGPVYFPQSQYKDSDNEITRAKKFFVYDFRPNEELECTLGFIIDKDLEDDVYLSLIGGQLDTLVKIF